MMTLGDTGRLLALVQAYDNRNVDELVITAWHAALNDLAFDDCCNAVREYFTSHSQWLMPDTIRDGVKRVRADRLARTPDPVPAVDPNQPRAFAQAIRDTRRHIADGQPLIPDRLRLEGEGTAPVGTLEHVRTQLPTAAKHQLPAGTAPLGSCLDPLNAKLDETARRRSEQEAAARAEIDQLHQQTGEHLDDEDQAEGSPS